MDDAPFFSVVIPTYNREVELSRAISSVMAQKYKDFDLWIVDDGSNDGTKNVVDRFQKEYPEKIFYLFHQNRGVSYSRNQGIMKSKGTWLAFLDSDDEWLPKKLEKQAKFIQDNPHILIVHGEEIWIRNGVRVNPMKKHQKFGGWIFEKCLPLCLISPSAVVIKRELLQEFNGFDEKFVVCEDYDLWLKITSRYEVGFIVDPLIKKFGGHADQLSRKFYAMDVWRVRALFGVLQAGGLERRERDLVCNEMRKKAEILINGNKKHGGILEIEEINEILLSIGGPDFR